MKEKIESDVLSVIRRELEILRQLDHPNVIKYYDVYEDKRYIHVVMELCKGGDLLSSILLNGLFSEQQTAILIRKVCKAVNYLHTRRICHRDVKLDNCLFATENSQEVKLVDFGLARSFSFRAMHTFAGTPLYMAPEVVCGVYRESCDVWSIGIMLFILLTGKLPFGVESQPDIIRALVSQELLFDANDWEHVSPFALDLVRKMLTFDPERRISIDQVLAHEWFQSNPSQYVVSRIPENLLDRLKHYKAPKRLQQIAIKVAVKYLSVEAIQDLKVAFQYIDTRNTGWISAAQFIEALNKTGLTAARDEVQSKRYAGFMSKIDYLHLGEINFTEFLAATLDLKQVLSEEVLYAAFRHFDVENAGYITIKDLTMAVRRTGVPLKSKDIDEMVAEMGLTEDCKISFARFRNILCKVYVVKGEMSPAVAIG